MLVNVLVQRRAALVVPQVGVGSGLHEELGGLTALVHARVVQRRFALVCACVEVRVVGDQQRHDRQVAVLHCDVKRSLSEGVSRHQRPTVAHERLASLEVTLAAGGMKRWHVYHAHCSARGSRHARGACFLLLLLLLLLLRLLLVLRLRQSWHANWRGNYSWSTRSRSRSRWRNSGEEELVMMVVMVLEARLRLCTTTVGLGGIGRGSRCRSKQAECPECCFARCLASRGFGWLAHFGTLRRPGRSKENRSKVGHVLQR